MSVVVFALYGLVAVALLFVYLTSTYNYWYLKKVARVSAITAVFGNVARIFSLEDNLSSLCHQLYRDAPNRSMFGFYFMRTPALLVREPQLVERVLSTKASNFQPFVCPNVRCDPLMAKCTLFGNEASISMVNAFTGKRLRVAFDSLRKLCVELNAHLRGKIEKSDEGDVVEIEMSGVFSRLAGQIVTLVGFGAAKGQNFVRRSDAVFVSSSLKKIFHQPSTIVGLRQAICLFVPKLAGFLNLQLIPTKTDRIFRETIRKIIENEEKNEDQPLRKGLLHWLVEEMSNEANDRVDKDQIAAQLFSFFIETYVVLSTVASFAVFCLAWHPSVQKRARRNIADILSRKHRGEFSYEALKDMGYLERIINETMRLNPVVGVVAKLCTEAVDLHGTDGQSCSLKRGDLVFISTRGIHLDEQLWPAPSDFDPERFSTDKRRTRHMFAFLPFEESQMCIAWKFNMMLLKMVLVKILRNYKLSASARTKIPFKLSTRTIVPMVEDGLWVKLTRLRNRRRLN